MPDEKTARSCAAAPALLEALRDCITERDSQAWKSSAHALLRLEAISNVCRSALKLAESGV
jgi:hypothetical protein